MPYSSGVSGLAECIAWTTSTATALNPLLALAVGKRLSGYVLASFAAATLAAVRGG